jgi:hypothetical protein
LLQTFELEHYGFSQTPSAAHSTFQTTCAAAAYRLAAGLCNVKSAKHLNLATVSAGQERV